MSDHHVHISSKHDLLDLKLGEVWRYRGLIKLFTKRSFMVTYKQTVLGPAWLFISPLLTSLVYLVLFGRIANLSTGGVPQLLFYLTGTGLWTFFSGCVTTNASTFINNSNLFGKVYFPRLVIPISSVLSAAIKLAIQMILVFVLLVVYVIGGQVSPNYAAWLLVIPAVLQLGLLGMGTGIIVSSLTTKYRDLSILVSFGVQLWMYASPVVYPFGTVGEGWLRTLLIINPVSAPFELIRYALFGSGSPGALMIVSSCLWTLAALFGGIILFNRIERNFLDTV